MAAFIRRLKIERFRGVQSLCWLPDKGMNVILGGGDTGKSTILEAIGLLLSPTNTYTVSDSDYWRRDVDDEFCIESVISLFNTDEVSQQFQMNWPWEWDGQDLMQPEVNEEADDISGRDNKEPVYVIRVRGTSDLDLVYEIVQPNNAIDRLSVGLRRAIGLVRLSGDDRNDRDLRLVQGSGLDRLLKDPGLRGRLGRELAERDIKTHLIVSAQEALKGLDANFGKKALPRKLSLGLTGGPGLSINAMVGLTADKKGVVLPLSSWGAGTRRLSALTIADELQGEHPITVIDEVERGLEPYRQRGLVQALHKSGAQVFLTTHSAPVITAGTEASLWYLDANGSIGLLEKEKIARQQATDPEVFLARLAVVCEGATEVGFTQVLLEKSIQPPLNDHGLWLTDANGHEHALKILEAFVNGGLSFAGMVDDEGKHPTRWKKVKGHMGDLLCKWDNGCLEQNVIQYFMDDELNSLIEDPHGELTGQRLRTLAERLKIEQKDFKSIKSQAGENFHQLIIEAACGFVPKGIDSSKEKAFRSHGKSWFKTVQGGRELGRKAFMMARNSDLQDTLAPFVKAVQNTLGITPQIGEMNE